MTAFGRKQTLKALLPNDRSWLQTLNTANSENRLASGW
jgi:hypothetical protein